MGHRGRYELKYIVEETRARAITGFLRSYLRPSPYNRPGPIPGESVVSLYFDAPDLLFYRQNLAGLRNRIKLRIRFYDNDWERPAFLEIKRRVNDVVCKDRTMVSREVVRQMLGQVWPGQSYGSHLSAGDDGDRQGEVQQRFSRLCTAARARAVLYVSYVREAFVGSDDGELRVTVDRQIRATLFAGEDRIEVPRRGVPPNPFSLPPGSVVLELKFNHRCPRWLQHMVREFNLYRRSFCKYCEGAEALGLPLGQQDLAAHQWETIA